MELVKDLKIKKASFLHINLDSSRIRCAHPAKLRFENQKASKSKKQA
ncbi:hypothetical protein [Christiangramia aquimixticola]